MSEYIKEQKPFFHIHNEGTSSQENKTFLKPEDTSIFHDKNSYNNSENSEEAFINFAGGLSNYNVTESLFSGETVYIQDVISGAVSEIENDANIQEQLSIEQEELINQISIEYEVMLESYFPNRDINSLTPQEVNFAISIETAIFEQQKIVDQMNDYFKTEGSVDDFYNDVKTDIGFGVLKSDLQSLLNSQLEDLEQLRRNCHDGKISNEQIQEYVKLQNIYSSYEKIVGMQTSLYLAPSDQQVLSVFRSMSISDADTIDKFNAYYEKIFNSIPENKDTGIKGIPLGLDMYYEYGLTITGVSMEEDGKTIKFKVNPYEDFAEKFHSEMSEFYTPIYEDEEIVAYEFSYDIIQGHDTTTYKEDSLGIVNSFVAQNNILIDTYKEEFNATYPDANLNDLLDDYENLLWKMGFGIDFGKEECQKMLNKYIKGMDRYSDIFVGSLTTATSFISACSGIGLPFTIASSILAFSDEAINLANAKTNEIDDKLETQKIITDFIKQGINSGINVYIGYNNSFFEQEEQKLWGRIKDWLIPTPEGTIQDQATTYVSDAGGGISSLSYSLISSFNGNTEILSQVNPYELMLQLANANMHA